MADASVSYRDLKVWQKAMDHAENSFRATQTIPAEEKYGLTAQIRRSAVSVASNIAEGYGRDNDESFVQFLRVSQGSLKERETQIILSEHIGVMTSSVARTLLSNADEIGRMLRGLINSVRDRRTQ